MERAQKTYDVVVIGAGSGGLTAAVGFAKVGKSVLLVEREHMGGECTNSGCVPSKALLHHAKTYHQAVTIAGTTPTTNAYRVDAFSYVRKKINAILAEETAEHFEALGITVVSGDARFVAPCAIVVADTTYRYSRAVIATGSSPRLIEIPGLKTQDTLTNQNLFDLDRVPERTLVIGGGPIGMEMGQALALLGSQVTIATIDESLAAREDSVVAPKIEAAFEALGITVLHCAHIEHAEGRQASFAIKRGSEVVKHETVTFDKVLVAIGRVPNLPEGLEEAGIAYDKRGIKIDGQYRTANRYVFAVGDVSQTLKFTHTASDAARQVVRFVASWGVLRVNNKKAVPKVTYTSPEIASVGMNYQEACQRYHNSEVMRLEVPYTEADRAVTDEATEGIVVFTVRRLNGAVLGATVFGAHAGELISLATLAIDQKISMWKLQQLIYAYPTYGQLIQKVGDQFLAQQLTDLKHDIIHLVKKHLPKLIAAVFWVTLIYQFQHYRLINHLSYTDVLLQLIDFFTTSMWGPFVYMLAYTIRPLILFPATLLTALSGVLFGFWWGIIYTLIGENLSANLAYGIGRFFGKDLRLEDSVLGNWIEWLRSRPFESVLFMRLFYVPFDLCNYGSGVLGVRWASYALATFIGILPGLTTFVALGAAINLEQLKMDGLTYDALDPKYLALSVGIFIFSIVLSRLLRRFKAE